MIQYSLITMCFTKIFVTLLTLPLLNNAEIKILSGHNDSLFILYKTPHQQLWHVLERIQQRLKNDTEFATCTEENGLCVTTNQCNKIGALMFETPNNSTCSLLLFNTQEGEVNSIEGSRPTSLKVWGFGLVSVGIISLSGLFGGLFWPLINSNFYSQMMRILIGLAVGSLTATSTFQLIPEGFEIKDDDHLSTAVFMWGSLWALYMFEVLSKILFHEREKEQTSNLSLQPTKDRSEEMKDEVLEEGLLSKAKSHQDTASLTSITDTQILKKKKQTSKTTVAYMIIFGDALHNFIDGMSIGAGYSKDLSAGLGISIAIACEEFPHELGDFAILINSGMPLKKALLYNFMSACTSFGGLVLGILMGELQTSVYIFAFAGGLFLYIALADLMPELNKMVDEELPNGKIAALTVLLLQNTGIFIGVTTLYFVTKYPVKIS